MTKMGVYRFKNEYGLYFLVSKYVLEEVSAEIGITVAQAEYFLWLYYINKYILKSSYLMIPKALPYMKRLSPKGKTPALTLIHKLLHTLKDKGLLNQVDSKFPIDVTMGRLISRFSENFMSVLQGFHLTSEGIRKEIVLKNRIKRKRKQYAKRKKPKTLC